MNKQELEYYGRKYGVLSVTALAVLIALLPLVLRMLAGAPITPGPQGYLWLRYASLAQHGVFAYDPLHQAAIVPNPYTLALAVLGALGVPWLLPLLLCLLFLSLLYLYFERVLRSVALSLLALGIVLLSPTISVLATTHDPRLLAMIFLLGALLLQERPLLMGIAMALGVMTSPAIGLLACAGLMSLQFVRDRYGDLLHVAGAAAVGILWHILWSGHIVLAELSPHFSLRLFFELGTPGGLSLFFTLLAAYGLVMRFGKDQRLMLATVFIALANLFLPVLTPITCVAIAVFAAHATYHLLTTRWTLELLQQAVLMLIGCIALFLLITAVRERVAEQPSPDLAHVMILLRYQYRQGNVLTDPSYATVVEEFTGRSAVLDDATPSSTLQSVLYGRSSDQLYAFLARNDATFVLVTDDMRERRFSRSDQGILLIVDTSERFVKIEDTAEGTLWYFIKT